MARAIARASPRRMASTGKELAGDDQPLDLAGALADRGELHVAEVLLRGVVLDEPVAAMNLDAVLGRANGNLARVQLGYRRFQRRAAALVLHRRGPVGQQARRVDPDRVVDQLGANALERSNRLAELPPLEGVAAR